MQVTVIEARAERYNPTRDFPHIGRDTDIQGPEVTRNHPWVYISVALQYFVEV